MISKKKSKKKLANQSGNRQNLGQKLVEFYTSGNKNIGIIGCGRSCGATTLSLLFAYYYAKSLRKKVSFTQLTLMPERDNSLFIGLGFDRRFEDQFADIYRTALMEEGLVSVRNFFDGINFRVPDGRQNTYKEKELEEIKNNVEIPRLIASARGDVNIFDIDSELYKNRWVMDFDMLMVVVDPLPSFLNKYQDVIRYFIGLENRGIKIIWIVNKMNNGVPKSQIKQVFKGRNVLFYPVISTETVYNYQYKCQPIYKDKVVLTNFD